MFSVFYRMHYKQTKTYNFKEKKKKKKSRESESSRNRCKQTKWQQSIHFLTLERQKKKRNWNCKSMTQKANIKSKLSKDKVVIDIHVELAQHFIKSTIKLAKVQANMRQIFNTIKLTITCQFSFLLTDSTNFIRFPHRREMETLPSTKQQQIFDLSLINAHTIT